MRKQNYVTGCLNSFFELKIVTNYLILIVLNKFEIEIDLDNIESGLISIDLELC